MQRFEQDGVIYEEAGNGQVRVVGYADAPASSPGGVFTLPPDPMEQARDARARAADRRAQTAEERAAAKDAREQREWEATHNPDGSPKPVAAKNGSAELTAATRANAINAFTATRQLDTLIADIEGRFKKGPGATSGPMGALDWLPTPGNRQFDAAGNAVRGAAITALGFTSGQTNTPREVEQNIGPYIPQAGDYDAVIADKIARLKELRDRARVQAATVLGGVPDASGRIMPLDSLPKAERDRIFPPGTMQPLGPSGGGGSSGGGSAPAATDRNGVPLLNVGGDQGVAFSGDAQPVTGARMTRAQEQQIAAAIRQGDRGQAAMLLQRYAGGTLDQAEANIASAAAIMAKNPNAQVGFDYSGVDQVAQSEADRKRYGDNLAPALQERATAAGADVTARSAVNGLTGGLADYAAALGGTLGGGTFRDNLQRQQALSEADARLSPTNSMISNIVGGAAGAALTEGAATALLPARAASWAPRLGDMAYGTVAGATASTPGDEATGGATGAASGLLGGMFGRGVVRGAGAVARGARNASADYLRERGVPLTVGQIVGNGGRVGQAIKGIEDRLTGIPGVGAVVNARRREGLEGFNRAAFREGLDPIGVTPRDIAEQGIEQGQQAASDAYANALSGVNVVPDPQFNAEFAAARAAGRGIARTGPEFDQVIAARVDPHLGRGSFDGPAVQDALQGLRGATYSADSMGNLAREATGNVEDALTGLVSRQAPDVMPQLDAANGAYRRLNVLGDAVGRAANAEGVFAPAQLGMAARSNATKFTGKLNAATTRRPFFDLQRAGQEVLPSQVPDSGTAGRLATLALPATLGGTGAGLGYAGGDTQTGAQSGLALGALLAAGGTRAGQRALTSLISDRPDALVRIGEEINRRARIGGIFGAPLLANTPLLQGQ